MRVMLVDDDADLRFMVRRYLESMSHTVIDADGGRVAVQKLRSTTVDVIVSDLYMPDGDGLELVRQVSKRWPEIRLIMVSSGGTLGLCDLLPVARSLGASATLRKPLHLRTLLEAVESQNRTN
jgi:two-component system, chemotaxis family, chemotaxis protein CheY